MALQSSGQISLSDIATEFGGSAPHALSEYYNKGNAPSSGEIELATDFYGTSNATTLTTTMTVGYQQHKVAMDNRGFMSTASRRHGVVMANNVANAAIGSLGNNTTSTGSVVEGAHLRSGQNANGTINLNVSNFMLELSAASTSWTSVTVNTTTLSRTGASTSDNQFFEWSNVGVILPQSGSVTFNINA